MCRCLYLPAARISGTRPDSQAMELYHSAIRDCGYSLIRNAGHLMHEEKPERVAAAMFEFIPAAVPEI